MNKDLSGCDVVDNVYCGFNKYSLGISVCGNLVICYGSEPIYSKLELADLSVKDMRNLSEMFLLSARNADKNLSARNAEKKLKNNK